MNYTFFYITFNRKYGTESWDSSKAIKEQSENVHGSLFGSSVLSVFQEACLKSNQNAD